MGVIKRQTLKASVVSYVGAGIGMISVLFILPYCLTLKEIGLIRLISDAVILLGSMALFGSGYSVLYFYPKYNSSGKQLNSFLSLQLLLCLIGFVAVTGCFLLSRGTLIGIYTKTSPEFLKYLYILPLMVFFFVIHSFFEAHSSNLLRITIPKIIREVLMRLLLILSVVIFYFNVVSFNGLVIAQLIILVIATGVIWYYVQSISHHPIQLTTEFPPKEKVKEILNFNFFVLLAFFGGLIANKIDSFFLAGTEEGLGKNGIYTTALYILAMIEIPTRSMMNITTPVISKALHENNLEEVNTVYKKSSITLITSGLFIFLCIWLNIDNLFQIMPHGEQFVSGKIVILLLGISKLFDAATSVNISIVNNSTYYRYSLMFQVLLGLFTIVTAYLLIPKYGITGAAISTALSIFLYQLIITVFVRVKFHVFPFTIATFKVLFIAAIVYLIAFAVPLPFHAIIQILIRTSIITIVYVALTYYLKISPDINDLADGALKKLRILK